MNVTKIRGARSASGATLLLGLAWLGGCALPASLQVASLAIEGFSLAATEKTVPDHGLSALVGRDCSMLRGLIGEAVCRDEAPTTVVAGLDGDAAPAPVSAMPVQTAEADVMSGEAVETALQALPAPSTRVATQPTKAPARVILALPPLPPPPTALPAPVRIASMPPARPAPRPAAPCRADEASTARLAAFDAAAGAAPPQGASVAPAAAPPVAASPSAVGLHLASFRSAQRAALGWRILRQRHPRLLAELKPVIRRVELTGKGVYYRVFARATDSIAEALCSRLAEQSQYCRTMDL